MELENGPFDRQIKGTILSTLSHVQRWLISYVSLWAIWCRSWSLPRHPDCSRNYGDSDLQGCNTKQEGLSITKQSHNRRLYWKFKENITVVKSSYTDKTLDRYNGTMQVLTAHIKVIPKRPSIPTTYGDIISRYWYNKTKKWLKLKINKWINK